MRPEAPRVKPWKVFEGLPEDLWYSKGDKGAMLVYRLHSLCSDGPWGTEKLNARRIGQARKRLFRSLGLGGAT